MSNKVDAYEFVDTTNFFMLHKKKENYVAVPLKKSTNNNFGGKIGVYEPEKKVKHDFVFSPFEFALIMLIIYTFGFIFGVCACVIYF